VDGRLLLDVVVGEGAAVLQLLPCKNQALLVGRDPLLVLDFRLRLEWHCQARTTVIFAFGRFLGRSLLLLS